MVWNGSLRGFGGVLGVVWFGIGGFWCGSSFGVEGGGFLCGFDVFVFGMDFCVALVAGGEKNMVCAVWAFRSMVFHNDGRQGFDT